LSTVLSRFDPHFLTLGNTGLDQLANHGVKLWLIKVPQDRQKKRKQKKHNQKKIEKTQ